MKKVLLTTFGVLILSILSGCTTTKTLTQADCTTADWQKIGVEDGKRGANSQVILRHTKTCQSLATPSRELWEKGRQEGLKSYCTTKNAYDIGRMGYTLSAVCDDANLAELHHANMMGLQQYEMSQRINHLNRGWGYYEPFVPFTWWW